MGKALATIVLLLGCWACLQPAAKAQSLYFPPPMGTSWDTLAPQRFGYQQAGIDSLYGYLDRTNTKAFILLRDGKLVLERYFDRFTRDSVWYWASAGKTMTAFAVGLAQQEGLLNINQPTSAYLGPGWTSLPPAQEQRITVRHQLSMTTGLDDAVPNLNCTRPACLTYRADPGTRWAYHNAPYTLLDSVVQRATGQSMTLFLAQRLRLRTGINGIFLPTGDNNVYYSTARTMARFGLLMLNRGTWGTTPILTDTAYYRQLITPSQALNPSYGYLWWLNGQAAHMLPQVPQVYPGPLTPIAPADMYAALGKDGQMLCVVPSQRLVWVRLGQAPPIPGGLVVVPYLNQTYTYINRLAGPTAGHTYSQNQLRAWPQPARTQLFVEGLAAGVPYQVFAATGKVVLQGAWPGASANLSVEALPPGLYRLQAGKAQLRFMKE